MATYLDLSRVQLLCSCDRQQVLSRLYFCRHCYKLRCSGCVNHEVDSHYCPNCMENMPSPEAKMKKNRCANCFDCPSCGHILSVRATGIAVPNPADPSKTIPQKVFYMTCGYCRWSTRDGGIPDQKASSGLWPEIKSEHTERISALIESFRAMAVKEKVEKERKKYAKRRSFLSFDRYGLTPTAVAFRRRSMASAGGFKRLKVPQNSTLKLDDVIKQFNSTAQETETAEPVPAAEASSEVEPLDESYYTQPLCIEKKTTITQRLMAPETQPENTRNLHPRHKHLLIKRSLRCKECEHNLSKPEFNPNSIKFKIISGAFNNVPEIRIKELPKFEFNQISRVVLTLYNPLHRVTTVTFGAVSGEADEFSTAKIDVPNVGIGIGEHPMSEGIEEVCEKVQIPEKEFPVRARDETAEYVGVAEQGPEFNDDPKVVAFRRANKLGIYFSVTPMKSTGDVKVSFMMTYDYKNPSYVIEPKENEEIPSISQRIFVNFGPLKKNGEAKGAAKS